MIFHVVKTDVEFCVEKCSNDKNCSFFSISGSNICWGFKECTEKMQSKNRNKLYRKGNYIFLGYILILLPLILDKYQLLNITLYETYTFYIHRRIFQTKAECQWQYIW